MGMSDIAVQPVDEDNSESTVRFLIDWVSEPFSSSDFAGLKDVYRVGELPSPSPSAAVAGSLRRGCRW